MQGSTSFETITSYFPDKLRRLLLNIPRDKLSGLMEVRLRAGGAMYLVYSDKISFILSDGGLSSYYNDKEIYNVTAADVKETVERLCHYSLHSCGKQLSQGYFVVENGVRVGVSGAYSSTDKSVLREFTSLNFRVSRCVEGCADEIFASNYDKNIIICGGVNSGKTTILRDICRITGSVRKCALIDERNEIACLYDGVPQNDVGAVTDIISNCSRSAGIISAVRTLSPEVIVCDEIASMSDSEAIISGIGCGVRFIVTAHGTCYDELIKRRELAYLIESGLFDVVVFLRGASAPSKIREIKRLKNGN
ncbi:hypothetical protein [uncultured Ruminococcus sp.]|uniref:hypothetical protein n=1 Tax=uncultured Ruminococcus sp. TaxID=165186 RepID=UPI0025DBE3BD|nr:hypothetical protein [uncultured Ruminococcus sp.]